MAKIAAENSKKLPLKIAAENRRKKWRKSPLKIATENGKNRRQKLAPEIDRKFSENIFYKIEQGLGPTLYIMF